MIKLNNLFNQTTRPPDYKTIYIIAGEQSGDQLGASLMQDLIKQNGKDNIKFIGVGGHKMQALGLNSLFDIKEISLMGFLEIVPHIPKLLKLINKTIEDIKLKKPDILITIDSPGFNLRVAKKIKKLNLPIKLVHFVAPSVWAYKKKRAIKFAKIFDKLLCLLPFEPELFKKYNLDAEFVGHPIINKEDIKISKEQLLSFKNQYNIMTYKNNIILLCMLGSRKSEIDNHLPIFLETIKELNITLKDKNKILTVLMPAIEHLKPYIKQEIENLDYIKIIDSNFEKECAYKIANIGLIKSGTSTLEVAKNNIPFIVGYKTSFISFLAIKLMAYIKYATLINIMANKEIIPEFLQYDCTKDNLKAALINLIDNKKIRDKQIDETNKILEKFKKT